MQCTTHDSSVAHLKIDLGFNCFQGSACRGHLKQLHVCLCVPAAAVRVGESDSVCTNPERERERERKRGGKWGNSPGERKEFELCSDKE